MPFMCFDPVARPNSPRFCTDYECPGTGCCKEASPVGVPCEEYTCLARGCPRIWCLADLDTAKDMRRGGYLLMTTSLTRLHGTNMAVRKGTMFMGSGTMSSRFRDFGFRMVFCASMVGRSRFTYWG